jgi:hypothetical protein
MLIRWNCRLAATLTTITTVIQFTQYHVGFAGSPTADTSASLSALAATCSTVIQFTQSHVGVFCRLAYS